MKREAIHFVWLGDVPEWVTFNLHQWKATNPFAEITVHGEEVLLDRYVPLYKKLTDLCQKSDLLRLSVLEREGQGWYFDSDFVPVRPLSELIRHYRFEKGIFLSRQFYANGPKCIANGIIGIRPDFAGWDFIHQLVEEQAARPIERCSFGPLLTTRFVKEQKGSECTVGLPEHFYWFCPREKAIQAYQENVAEGPMPEIYLIHLWLGGDYSLPELMVAAKTGGAE